MVEHPASRGVCFADASAFNGNDHAGRHAAYGFGILDVYGGGCTNARALHHSGARTPCRLVRRIEGGKAMNWTSPAEFRSEEHTSELQSLMRISYAVFCLKKKK